MGREGCWDPGPRPTYSELLGVTHESDDYCRRPEPGRGGGAETLWKTILTFKWVIALFRVLIR